MSWMSLLAGWRGFGCHRRLVTISDIQQFAFEKLEAASESSSNLAELTGISETEQDQVDALLGDLTSADQTDYEMEVRKWIVCLLEKQLEELPNDPLYGLLQLTEFWSDLGFPDYSPHHVQGRGNKVSPKDYYTRDNYMKTVDQHKRWIEKEVRSFGAMKRN